MLKTLVAAAAALALSAGAASAAVTITDANVPGNPEENIQLTQDTPGTTILGVTNQTNTSVSFVGDEMLNAPAQGQARIVAVDGGFSYLEIFLTNPNLGFTALELNINALADGMANFYAYSLSNVLLASTSLAIGANGENRINIFTDGELLGRVVFDTTVDVVADVRQIRIGGVSAIPEPGTWALMIAGFGLMGAAVRQARRQRLLAA
jgi:hypothetical protein